MTNNTESLKSKSYKAFAWDFLGKIIWQTIGFVVSIFLSRLLSPNEFGLIAMVTIVVWIAGNIMDMGFGAAIIQKIDVTDAHYGSVFFYNIITGVGLSILLFFSAPFIADFYHQESLTIITRVLSLIFIINSIGNVVRLKFRKELEYKIPTQSNIIGAITGGLVATCMAFLNYGVWALVIQSLVSPLVANSYVLYKSKWRPKFIFSWTAIKDLWGFGSRIFANGIFDSIFVNADSIIIGKLFSAETLGYYFRAKSLNQYVYQYSSGSIMHVLFPAFSQIQNDLERFRNVVFKGYHVINLLAFYLTGLLFVIGSPLIIFLFGPQWIKSIPLFKLIIIIAFIPPLNSILSNILTASGNSRTFLRLETGRKIFLCTCFLIGFIWGIEGYLIASAIANIFATFAYIFYSSKQLKVKTWQFIKISIPYLLLTIICIIICTLLSNQITNNNNFLLILVSTLVFSTIYFTLAIKVNLQGTTILISEIQQTSQYTRVLSYLRRIKKS